MPIFYIPQKYKNSISALLCINRGTCMKILDIQGESAKNLSTKGNFFSLLIKLGNHIFLGAFKANAKLIIEKNSNSMKMNIKGKYFIPSPSIMKIPNNLLLGRGSL